jgi:RNA polymerase sigma-70 factor, ECF subfamily
VFVNSLSSYETFSELLNVCHTQLFGYLYALVQDIHDAEDLYQKTSLVLWQKFDQYRSGSNFFQWARAAARFEALNYLRRRKHRQAMFSAEFHEELAAVWAEVEPELWDARREALGRCVGKLPENDRQLVAQCFGSDEPLRSTAEQLGRSPKSVYDALGRIRRALFRCIEAALAKEGIT